MKAICNTCKIWHPVTIDHNEINIICTCINCGENVPFGRIHFIDSAKKSCQMISEITIDIEKIKQYQSVLCINKSLRLVRRDVEYHNLLILFRMENDCHKCSYSGPVKFSTSGQHIKASCGKCGFYIMFTPSNTVPNFIESKNKIWCLTKDLKLIGGSEIKCGVHTDLREGAEKNIAYHNLYSYITKNLPS